MTEAYSWNQEVGDCDSSGYILLPPGTYPFKIVSMEKSFQNATAKIVGGCPKAIISIEVNGGAHGTGTWNENMLLHEVCRGILGSFFLCIGLRAHGQTVNTGWFDPQYLVGKSGSCKIGTRKWKDKDGNERESNQVKTWIEPTVASTIAASAPAPAPAPQTAGIPPVPNLNRQIEEPIPDDDIPF